jgi:hypothetical protein
VLFHHHEAQAIDHAVLLVGVPLEVLEGGALVVFGGPEDPGQLASEQPLAGVDRLAVARFTVGPALALPQVASKTSRTRAWSSSSTLKSG